MSRRNRAVGPRPNLWWGLMLCVMVAGTVVWIGCLPVLPTDTTTPVTASGTKRVNTPPSITVTSPSSDLVISQGDEFDIAWDDTDPDDNAVITIFLDPDSNPGSGNELLVIAGRQEDPDGPLNDSIEVDTALLNIPVGAYRIIATIQDASGATVTHSPSLIVQVLPEGISPGNDPPKIKIVEPTENIGAVQGDTICVVWEASDSDNPTATVTISLDYDLDPTNDDDPNNPNPPILLASNLPLSLVDLLDPNSDTSGLDPNDPNVCLGYQIVVDTTGKIPPRDDGLPYFIQAEVDDGINPPVHAYAIGWLTIQKWAAGVVDLMEAGEGLAAAVFQGFHGRPDPLDANQVGGQAGSWATTLGDFDGDGYDDFVVVARYGNPRGRGNIGQAYMVYGRATRFSSKNSLNSVGTNIHGCQFHAPKNWIEEYGQYYGFTEGGDGGLASATYIDDLDGDGKPELIFGLPDVFTYENMDYDPIDEDDLIYSDDFRRWYSDNDAHDDWGYDRMSLVVYVSSQQTDLWNRLEQNTIDLRMVGQKDPEGVTNDEWVGTSGDTVPTGVRFRGDHPYLLGATQFGETVSALPDTNSDGTPELMFSAPQGGNWMDVIDELGSDLRGRIDIYLGFDFTLFGGQPVKSFPWLNGEKFGSGDDEYAWRWVTWPELYTIEGAYAGDQMGRALHAGDFNQDGSPDIACGAPMAERNNLEEAGVSYILFGQLVVGHISVLDHPRIEIIGTAEGDRLGEAQDGIGDFNGDSIDDVVIGSRYVDCDTMTDCGFAAVLYGGRQLTGERTVTKDDLATPAIPGVMFIGPSDGSMAGAMVGPAGDFNGDGRNDILICAPGAQYTYSAGGTTLTRLGVCYLIFGNNDLTNKTLSLEDVGSADLPGIVFVSPYEMGSADEAGVDTCFTIGDINGDGYSEILIGNTGADYVNPANPSQRRVGAGECYIIYGNNYGTNAPSRW